MKKIFLMMLMLVAVYYARSQQITKMEYFVDTDPGFGNGTDIPVTPSSDVSANFNIDLTGLSPGIHMIGVRSREDNSGGVNRVWSTTAASLFVTVDLNPIPNITGLEYFIDTDPGYGLATPVVISSAQNITASFPIDISGLAPGVHQLLIRVKNSYNDWSVVAVNWFYAYDPVINSDITQMEYFFDTDPGFGAGKQVPVVPGKNISKAFSLDTAGLTLGVHMLSIRTKNQANRWSVLTSFPILNLDPSIPDIVQLEYFLDNDPGFGAGIQVPISSGKDISANLILDTTGLSQGRHFLLVRAKNTKNNWGVVGYQEFSIFKTKLFLEGLYVTSTGMMNPAQSESGNQWGPDIADHITLQLRDQYFPYDVVFEEESELSTNGIASLIIPQHLDQNYVAVRHRNSIETWSSVPLSIPSLTTPYDFTSASSMAYGDNMRLMGTEYAIWGGDVNQDGIIDSGDMNPIENASIELTMGYVSEDVNGDGLVDSSDMNIVENNSIAIVTAITP